MVYSVGKIMAKHVVTAKADDSLEEAYHKLKKNKIRHLPIIDDCGDVVGVISDRDFQRAMLRDKYDKTILGSTSPHFAVGAKVASFMSWPVKTVSTTETLINVSKKMIKEKVSAYVVVSDDYVVGIITHEDLLRMLVHILSEQENTLMNKVESWAYNSPIGRVTNFLGDIGI